MIKMKRCNIFINGFRTIIFCKKVTQGDLLCCLVLLLLFLIYLFFCFGHAGLHCQAQAFSSWSEWGTLFVVFKSLLMAVAPLWSTGSRAHGLQWLWHMDLAAPWHVESSWTRDQTGIPCICNWTLTTVPAGKSSIYYY